MREWKRTQDCIEGALALSHKKNPRIFNIASDVGTGLFSLAPPGFFKLPYIQKKKA